VIEVGAVQRGQADAWRKTRAELSRVDFAFAHPYLFLVRTSGSRLAVAGFSTDSLQVNFHTVIQPQRAPIARPSMDALATPDLPSDELLVFPLRKAPGNPFPERISLGRAPNCDVSIRDGSISKLHGHFRDVTADSAVFVDGKSANGTRVDGSLVEAGTPCAITNQSRITFGRIRLDVLTAGQLYDIL
jgi:hypothetical protein